MFPQLPVLLYERRLLLSSPDLRVILQSLHILNCSLGTLLFLNKSILLVRRGGGSHHPHLSLLCSLSTCVLFLIGILSPPWPPGLSATPTTLPWSGSQSSTEAESCKRKGRGRSREPVSLSVFLSQIRCSFGGLNSSQSHLFKTNLFIY